MLTLFTAGSSHNDNVTLTSGPVGRNSGGLSSVQESVAGVRTRKEPQQHIVHVQNPAYDNTTSDMGLQHTYATPELPPINMKNHPPKTYSKQGNFQNCV